MSRGKEDWRRMRELRARADAILIGATNLRVDDPGLSLSPEERARRGAAGQPLPARIVVTRRGEGIRPDAKVFDRSIGGPAYVVHTANMSDAVRALLAPVATLVEMGDTSVPVDRLLVWMRGTLGAQTVMCEGGGDLVAHMFAARAVDELYVTVVPRIWAAPARPRWPAAPASIPTRSRTRR
jgi:5-amino-6-(5-phosphoribosylamino)uracil reductase